MAGWKGMTPIILLEPGMSLKIAYSKGGGGIIKLLLLWTYKTLVTTPNAILHYSSTQISHELWIHISTTQVPEDTLVN